MENKLLIKLKNVSFGYSKKGEKVIKNFSLSVNSGDWVLLYGENGSGKTTLFKLILGELKNKEGEIYKFCRKERITYIPQLMGNEQESPFSLLDVVKLGEPNAFSFNTKKASELIERVGLSKKKKFRLHELSGGQRRCAYIAKALMAQSKIILMDEPFSNLDGEAESNMIRMISDLVHNNNIAVVSTSHKDSLQSVSFSKAVPIAS